MAEMHVEGNMGAEGQRAVPARVKSADSGNSSDRTQPGQGQLPRDSQPGTASQGQPPQGQPGTRKDWHLPSSMAEYGKIAFWAVSIQRQPVTDPIQVWSSDGHGRMDCVTTPRTWANGQCGSAARMYGIPSRSISRQAIDRICPRTGTNAAR